MQKEAQMSAQGMTEERIYTVAEVAERLRVHPKTVRKMIADGDLDAFSVRSEYRIRQGALDKLMRNREKPPGKQ
jgi:excisionase family DNA binding protein